MRSGERTNPLSVLERADRLLRAFGPDEVGLGISELSRRSDLPKATALRLANQMVELGLLERIDSIYRPGIRLFELGCGAPIRRRLSEAALPYMQELGNVSQHAVHLGMLSGHEVLYLDKVAGRLSAPNITRIGTRKPPHCTALGKSLLSHSSVSAVQAVCSRPLPRLTAHTITRPERLVNELHRARMEGLAFDREECALGLSCVAAPILDERGQAIAALSVSGASYRFDPERVAPQVRNAARAIATELVGRAVA